MSNDVNLIELEEKRIIDNYGLVISQVLSFCNSPKHRDFEDYIQVGLIGLLKAIRKHDPSISKLSTYARACIRNEIIKYINKNKKHNYLPLPEEDIPSPPSHIGWDILTDSLTSEEKSILHMRLNSYSYREIAEEIDCSRNYIKASIKTILLKLRRDVE